jgi:ribonuclease BN (tRNA processing enzyme)
VVTVVSRVKLLPLGTNGHMPTYGRHTMSVALRFDDVAIVCDAGTGLSRLVEPAVREFFEGVATLHLVLSHYHLDHVVGLSYLPALWKQGPISLYAPSTPLVEASPADALERLLSPPLFGARPANWPAPIQLVPFDGLRLDIGGIPVECRAQTHPGGSVGLRFLDHVAYITDTAADAQTTRFARGVSVLLHELWLTDSEAVERQQELQGHSSLSGVAAVCDSADVGTVMPIHHNPRRTAADVQRLGRELSRRVDGRVVIPEEGCQYEIDGRRGVRRAR